MQSLDTDVMQDARRRTLALVAHLDDDELDRGHGSVLGPLAWDLGHVAAYEDLWLNHRLGGHELLRPRLAELYDAFETPRARRGVGLPFLRGDDVRAYLDEVRERSRTVPAGDGELHELVLRHELQHSETMLQSMALTDRLPPGFAGPQPVTGAPEDDRPGVALLGGDVRIGAPARGFAYDNERPRHRVALAPFRIARRPVSNATWLSFAEGGGYERREWWSDEGWAWKEDDDGIGGAAARAARAGHADAPAVHLSCFEAAALARAHDARLPTEAEWETAAASQQLAGIGEVWEWTSSPFAGYPGFRAHPYREYSEVFFGDRFRVLRGWSRATAPRVASIHFRTWERPRRRHLFSGVRLAADADTTTQRRAA